MTLIYFIIVLGVTVFIHEFGHFIFAKKSGIYVYEFSIGMGPRLFKFNRKNDETDYCIRLFPIGGFVQMAGEEIDDDDVATEYLDFCKKFVFFDDVIDTEIDVMHFKYQQANLFDDYYSSKYMTG